MLRKFSGRDMLRLSAEYNIEDSVHIEGGFRSYTPEAVMSQIFEFSNNRPLLLPDPDSDMSLLYDAFKRE
jgi:hypothetical protein